MFLISSGLDLHRSLDCRELPVQCSSAGMHLKPLHFSSSPPPTLTSRISPKLKFLKTSDHRQAHCCLPTLESLKDRFLVSTGLSLGILLSMSFTSRRPCHRSLPSRRLYAPSPSPSTLRRSGFRERALHLLRELHVAVLQGLWLVVLCGRSSSRCGVGLGLGS